MISVQSKALKGRSEQLKGKLNCTLKEDKDAKLARKEQTDQVLDFKAHMENNNNKTHNPEESRPFEYAYNGIRT